MNIKEMLLKYKGIVLYIIFGVLTTVVNLLVYGLFYYNLNCTNILSTIIAWIAAVAFAFITNKLFVFESKSMEKKTVFYELMTFVMCRVGTGVLEVGGMWLLVDVLILPAMLMKLFINVAVIVLNYVASKLVIFKKAKEK